MTEPSSGPSNDSTSAGDAAPRSGPTAPESVELDIDEEKVDAWDEVKSDYQVEPDGDPVPNSVDAPEPRSVEDEDDNVVGA